MHAKIPKHSIHTNLVFCVENGNIIVNSKYVCEIDAPNNNNIE